MKAHKQIPGQLWGYIRYGQYEKYLQYEKHFLYRCELNIADKIHGQLWNRLGLVLRKSLKDAND